MDNQSFTATQLHLGNGANKVNITESKIENLELHQISKHVIELAPHNIQKPVSEAITMIFQGKQKEADLIISTLELTNALDHEATTALLALKALSAQEHIDSRIIECLIQNKQSCTTGFVLDIVVAALIKNDISNGFADAARERYKSVSTPGTLTNNFYFKFLADYNELSHYYENNKLDLTTSSRISISYGYLRLNFVNHANQVLDLIKNQIHLPHVRKQFFLCKAIRLNDIFSRKHYWTISIEDKAHVDDVILQSIELIQAQDVDNSVANAISACLLNTGFENKHLINLCLSNEKVLNKLHSDVQAQLLFSKHKDPNVFNDKDFSEALNANKDAELKASLIKRIRKELKINVAQYFNIHNILSKDELKELLGLGLDIDFKDDFTKDVYKLDLYILASDEYNNRKNIAFLAKRLIKASEEQNKKIHPPTLLHIIQGLEKVKLIELALQLIELHVEKGTWLSPLYEFYLEFLLQIKQYKKLTDILESIPQSCWTFNCWAITVNIHQVDGSISEEVDTIKLMAKKYRDNMSVWRSLISAYERAGEKQKIIDLTNEIPTELFQNPCDASWYILFSFMRCGLFNYVEPIILRWFVDAPDAMSVPITNFALEGTIANIDYNFSHKVNNICECYVLKSAHGKLHIKLVVDGYNGKHSNIIDSNSPLAQKLLLSKVGDNVEHGIEDLIIQEIVPPFLGAAWRIAPKLRTVQNDGSDAFQLIELPSEKEEDFIESMKAIISKLEPSEEPSILQAHPDLPIQIKGFWSNSAALVDGVIQTMLDHNCVKNLIPSTDNDSNHLVLDLYSSIFISITSLHKTQLFKEKSYYITEETLFLLEAWLERSQKEHMRVSLGSNRDLIIADETHFLNQRLISGIEFILSISSIIQSKLKDTPLSIVKLEQYLDRSTFSSLCASSSYGYDYLSFDHNFVMLLKDTNLQCHNAQAYYLNLSEQLTLKEQQLNLNLLFSINLTVPVKYQTLMRLALTNNPDALQLISKIIRSWKPCLDDMEIFLRFLAFVISAGAKFKYFSKNIIDINIGSTLIYTALSCACSSKAPEAFTEDLMVDLITKTLSLSPQNDNYMQFLFHQFIDFSACNFLDISYINQKLAYYFNEPDH
ncbi:hypothetical protein [Pseudoalteromonas byunsanensis]|uniref:Uncharacterized protein n=1 Tax=Pseudoalteromonas byunsanensis TaxID=327939 RepID=A0A1S1N686_9GAMM|nr:hypothetical protein [Pseudoalteromonas byunsanensis]OHU95182.1 hypothetical protein BIW53_10675 [Pseudoalteromonas byunsanensis]